MRTAHTAAFLICLALGASTGAATLSGSPQRTPAGGGTAAQGLLNRAADAILALKSARFSIKREGTPAFLDEKNGVTFTAADCKYAAPDRVSCDVKVSLRNGTILQLTRVWVPEGTFQTNPLTRQYGKLPADSSFNGVVLFAKTGVPEIMRTGVTNLQNAGTEKLQNRDTIHVKGEVSGEKLNPLIGSTLKPDLSYPVDMWIDQTSAAPMQIHVAEQGGNGWQIELSAPNEPIDIPTPQVPPPTARPQG